MKKKGFTLIELLAVIVILAIIAVIATPMILGVIEKSKKGALIESVNGIIDVAEKYQMTSELNEEEYEDTIDLTGDTLSYKGRKPEKGVLVIEDAGIYVLTKYDNYCIEKDYNEKSPKIVDMEKCDNMKVPEIKIYGVKRNLDSSSTEWERIEDSVGLVANAQVGTTSVQNDFDSIYPWSDIISYNYDTDTKQVTATYGEDNFKFDGSNGEVLTKIPEFYYKREQKDGYEYIYISKNKKAGYTKSEEFSIGRYTMSGDENRVYSRSGVKPLTDHTISEYREYATNLGSEFSQLDYHYFLIQLLYLVEYADYDSQAKLGLGYTNSSNTEPVISGGTDILGMKSGSVDGTDTTSMIYRGMEDIYGNIFQFIDGINIKDNQAYICYDKNSYETYKYDGCYKSLGYVNATSASEEGWITKLGYDSSNPLIAFPIEIGRSDSLNIKNYYWQGSGNRIVMVGGHFRQSSFAGQWCITTFNQDILKNDRAGSRFIKIGITS